MGTFCKLILNGEKITKFTQNASKVTKSIPFCTLSESVLNDRKATIITQNARKVAKAILIDRRVTEVILNHGNVTKNYRKVTKISDDVNIANGKLTNLF